MGTQHCPEAALMSLEVRVEKLDHGSTTAILRGLNRYVTASDLLRLLDYFPPHMERRVYDFVYVPWATGGTANIGLAFVNFEEHWQCRQFLQCLRSAPNQRHLLQWGVRSVGQSMIQGRGGNLEAICQKRGLAGMTDRDAPLCLHQGKTVSATWVLEQHRLERKSWRTPQEGGRSLPSSRMQLGTDHDKFEPGVFDSSLQHASPGQPSDWVGASPKRMAPQLRQIGPCHADSVAAYPQSGCQERVLASPPTPCPPSTRLAEASALYTPVSETVSGVSEQVPFPFRIMGGALPAMSSAAAQAEAPRSANAQVSSGLPPHLPQSNFRASAAASLQHFFPGPEPSGSSSQDRLVFDL
eukprot:s3906_g1.t2